MNMAAKGLTHFLLFWLFVAGVVGLFYRQEISEWVIDVAGDSEIAAYLKSDDGDDAAAEKTAEPAAEKPETPAQAEPAPEPKPEAPAPTPTETAAAPQEPTPEPTPAAEPETQAAAEQVAERAPEPAAEPAAEPAVEGEPQPTGESTAETVAESKTTDATAETAPAPAEETASAPAEQAAAPSETAAAPAPTEAAPAPMQAAPAPMPGAPVPPQMAAPAPALSPELVRDWSQARDLYWRGDLAKAEEVYMSLVRDHADEPDLAGELANLLLQVGKPEDAAGFYLEAGLRMLRGPRPGRAGMVVGILNRLSPDKAEVLRKKLMEKMHPPAGTSN